jgi:hypothetical protein
LTAGFTSLLKYATRRAMQRLFVIVCHMTMTHVGGPVEGVVR